MSALDGPIPSMYSIALIFPAESHLQHTQSRERWGQGWDEHYRSSREGGKIRIQRRASEGQEKRENRRLILRKLCAALLGLFRGQHREKMKESAWGNWDSREVQQPFQPNPNGVGDRTTMLRRLLIGAANELLAPVYVFL